MAEYSRKNKWIPDAALLLSQLVQENQDIIRGKYGPGVTSKLKKAAWADIASKITEAFPVQPRNPKDCEKKWYALLSQSRQKISEFKNHQRGTGGGKAKPPLSPVSNKVWDILGDDNPTLPGDDHVGIDTSEYDSVGEKWCSTIVEAPEPGQQCTVTLEATPAGTSQQCNTFVIENEKIKLKNKYEEKKTECKARITKLKKHIYELKMELADTELEFQEIQENYTKDLLKMQ